ncbi:uncharacterized protein LOC111359555 [Spodoptera litura]|uniref:Uncharacterized protein LOC111359555 n=1 Tax=Spodoptera litura TaxID=69820 RepID=A0A9J7EMX3_SPOLT|nr:uncharacterized protein LOC111359555 [Spodoptera litura]
MAKVKTWKTKADVLRDIAEATGTAPKNDIAAQYIVVGDAPPPPRLREDEDDEMELMFGNSYRRLSQTENTGPDLAGIRQMLDMVRNLDCNDDDEDAVGDHTNYAITISKVKSDSLLNPNVPEFVPNGGVKKETNINGVVQSASAYVETRKQTCDTGSSNHVAVEAGTQATNYEHITKALKNTISEAARSDSQSFHLKKQKNVAIATLLRLYANNDTSCKPDVKLWTPEQFERTKNDSSDVKVEENNASGNATPKEQALPSTRNELLRSPDSSDNINPSRALVQDPEVRESIAKVNRWLAAPIQEKPTKTPYLGPISFKKKNPVVKPNTATPSPQPSTPSNSDSPSRSIQLYQPTKFAADLGKQFRERIEQKQIDAELQVPNWENLSDVLKQKERNGLK